MLGLGVRFMEQIICSNADWSHPIATPKNTVDDLLPPTQFIWRRRFHRWNLEAPKLHGVDVTIFRCCFMHTDAPLRSGYDPVQLKPQLPGD